MQIVNGKFDIDRVLEMNEITDPIKKYKFTKCVKAGKFYFFPLLIKKNMIFKIMYLITFVFAANKEKDTCKAAVDLLKCIGFFGSNSQAI